MHFTSFIVAVVVFRDNASVGSCTAIEMQFEILVRLISSLLQGSYDFRLMAGEKAVAFIEF